MYHSSVAVHPRSSSDAASELKSTGKEPWAHSFWILLLTSWCVQSHFCLLLKRTRKPKQSDVLWSQGKPYVFCSGVSAPRSDMSSTREQWHMIVLSLPTPLQKFLFKNTVYCVHCLLPLKQPTTLDGKRFILRVFKYWKVLATLASGTPKLHLCFTDILQAICIYPDLSVG